MSRHTKKPAVTYGVYAIIDIRTTPPKLVDWADTRSVAREEVMWNPDADHLRIRRAKVVLFQT